MHIFTPNGTKIGAGIFIEKGVPCQPAPLFEKMPVWDAWSMEHGAQSTGHRAWDCCGCIFAIFDVKFADHHE